MSKHFIINKKNEQVECFENIFPYLYIMIDNTNIYKQKIYVFHQTDAINITSSQWPLM